MAAKIYKSRSWTYSLLGCSDVTETKRLVDRVKFTAYYTHDGSLHGFVLFSSQRGEPTTLFKGLSQVWSPAIAEGYSLWAQSHSVTIVTGTPPSRTLKITSGVKLKRKRLPYHLRNTATDKSKVNYEIKQVYYYSPTSSSSHIACEAVADSPGALS